jgi:WD40 repeat protein
MLVRWVDGKTGVFLLTALLVVACSPEDSGGGGEGGPTTSTSSAGSGPGGSGPGGSGEGGFCYPTTSCLEEHAKCGEIPDGCGHMVDCGDCTAPDTCGGAGVPGLCGVSVAAVVKEWEVELQTQYTATAASVDWRFDGGQIALVASAPLYTFVATVDASSGSVLDVGMPGSGGAEDIVYAPAGDRVAVSTSALHTYDIDMGGGLSNWTEVPNHNDCCIGGIDYSPDGIRIVSSGGAVSDPGTHPDVSVWDGVDVVSQSFDSFAVYDAKFSDSGSYIAASLDERLVILNSITLNTVRSEQLLPDGSGETLGHVGWLPGNEVAAVVVGNVIVAVPANGTDTYQVGGASLEIVDFAIHPSHQKVAIAAGGSVKIVNMLNGQVEQTITHGDAVRAVAWSPDGSQLATAGTLPSLAVWSVSFE